MQKYRNIVFLSIATGMIGLAIIFNPTLNLDQDNQLITKSGKIQETNKLIPLIIGQSKIIRFYEIL